MVLDMGTTSSAEAFPLAGSWGRLRRHRSTSSRASAMSMLPGAITCPG
jgi:hypothetical protein